MTGLCARAAKMFARWAQALDPVPQPVLPEPITGQMLRLKKSPGPLAPTQLAARFEAHFEPSSGTYVVRKHRYESSYGPAGVGHFKMIWQHYKKEAPLFAGTAAQVTQKILELEQQAIKGLYGNEQTKWKPETLIGGYEGNIPHIRRQELTSRG
jgi:hypothetical protein